MLVGLPNEGKRPLVARLFGRLLHFWFVQPSAKYFEWNCMQYCFMPIINSDLQETAACGVPIEYVKAGALHVCPSGIPDELYFFPGNFDAEDYGIPVDNALVRDMQADCKPAQRCDSSDIEEYLDFVLQQYPQRVPQTPDDCVRLSSSSRHL